MKANELSAKDLMIGDWVCLPSIMSTDKYQVKVLEIQDDCIKYYCGGKKMMVRFKHIEPIPLTSEILKKNGFIEESRDCYGKPLQYCVLVDGLWIDITGENYFDGELKFVHQLQHALRLCEIEKEIVL